MHGSLVVQLTCVLWAGVAPLKMITYSKRPEARVLKCNTSPQVGVSLLSGRQIIRSMIYPRSGCWLSSASLPDGWQSMVVPSHQLQQHGTRTGLLRIPWLTGYRKLAVMQP